MTKTKKFFAVISFAATVALFACVPNSGIPSSQNGGGVTPIVGPSLDPNNPNNPVNPVDPSANPNDPSNVDPNNPVVNPSSSPDVGPHPNPPDPQQPTTEDDFWTLMKRFGFFESKTKEQLTADIKTGVALKISAWSPGTQKDVAKNIQAKYKDSAKYLNPAAKDVNDYQTRSMKMASASQSIDYYLDVTYGPKAKRGEIVLQKVNAVTLEVLFFNKSGLITNYTQTPGSLLRLAHFMKIPPSVYKN